MPPKFGAGGQAAAVPLIRLLHVGDVYSIFRKLVGQHFGLVTRQLCSELNTIVLDNIRGIHLGVRIGMSIPALSNLLQNARSLRSIDIRVVLYVKKGMLAQGLGEEELNAAVDNMPSVLDCIPNLNSLHTFEFSACKLLFECEGARKVWDGMTVSGLDRLKQCESLRSLSVIFVNDFDLESIRDCSSLVDLDLCCTRFSENSSMNLLGELNLRKLQLVDTKTSDVEPLGCLTSLEELHLNINPISNVNTLGKLANLHTLDLSETQVADVTALGNLTKLHTLNLSETQVADVTALGNLTKLHTLHLRKTQVTEITALGSLTKLRTLYLSCTHVSDVTALGNLTNLHRLYLSEISDVTALGNLTKLHTLHLRCTHVSDVTALGHLKSLQHLSIDSKNVPYDAMPEHLRPVNLFPLKLV